MKRYSVDEFLPKKKHIKINPTTTSNFSTTTSSATQEEEELVIVHLVDFHFGSKLLSKFYKSISKFKINSNIIINNNIYLSNEIIYHTKHNSKSILSIPPPQLLYRGSRDGFKPIDFHTKCDDQGPTLTIIKSEHNQIFGGFTTQSWKSPSSKPKFIFDSSAFIFKIDDENTFRKFKIKQGKKQHAILAYPTQLPIFGSACDIFICSDCNKQTNSRSNFGATYELPNDNNEFEYGNEKANNYLAGSHRFQVIEIEVFKIIR